MLLLTLHPSNYSLWTGTPHATPCHCLWSLTLSATPLPAAPPPHPTPHTRLQVLHTLSMAENNRVSDRRNILHVSSSRRQP